MPNGVTTVCLNKKKKKSHNTLINTYFFFNNTDFAFGKCLPQYGLVPEDLLREPLAEEETALLSTMLEDLQGASLNWEHPFVQCRMQSALYSLRNKTPMPQNICAALAPDPEILGPQSPLAFVRFSPPNTEFADEVYYPPLKKAFDDRVFMQPPKAILPPQPKVIKSEVNNEMENRQKDIQNRIELRKMLVDYESGVLKPPIYHKHGGFESLTPNDDNFVYENEANEDPLTTYDKRNGHHYEVIFFEFL